MGIKYEGFLYVTVNDDGKIGIKKSSGLDGLTVKDFREVMEEAIKALDGRR